MAFLSRLYAANTCVRYTAVPLCICIPYNYLHTYRQIDCASTLNLTVMSRETGKMVCARVCVCVYFASAVEDIVENAQR